MPEDAERAHALVQRQLAGTRYLARVTEQLDAALEFEDPEYMALLAGGEEHDAPVALALFGAVAGARKCVKLHALIGDGEAALTALVRRLTHVCERGGERLALCELPDDAPWQLAARVLLGHGYRDEGRVPDYVGDGLALRLLVWRNGS